MEKSQSERARERELARREKIGRLYKRETRSPGEGIKHPRRVFLGSGQPVHTSAAMLTTMLRILVSGRLGPGCRNPPRGLAMRSAL